ncbi:MAG TPA: hypothetical protein VGD56_21530 [Gemmatirosa sp.]
MLLPLVVLAVRGAAPTADTAAAPPPDSAVAVARATPDTARRPRAIEYSDAYATRLAIHRVASYTMLPLFAGEYWLGERLLSPNPQPGWVKGAHVGTAFGLAGLFTINTVTGLWNLYDSRHDTDDRTRKYLHTALLLASDAGFAYTGSIAGQAHNSSVGRTRHRNAALVSMGLSTAGTAMMWLWKK